MDIQHIHHVAIICADYARSKAFYTQVLGLRVLDEVYRPERRSYKLDLAVGNRYQIELFSFPSPPPRVDRPEAAGLRHLAFAIPDLDAAVAELRSQGVAVEAIRVDGLTGRRFTFIHDPDGLPLEFYEASEP
jgi:glyoxylase I family protein